MVNKLHLFQTNKIVKILKNNQAIFIPTDTVCGIMSANADILYKIKKRPIEKSIIKFICNKNQITNLTTQQKLFLKTFWPGPVTVIKDKIAYRIPNSFYLRRILKHFPYLYCTSANISGEKTINLPKVAYDVFGNQIAYVVSTFKGSNLASSIIDIDNWQIIREGDKHQEVKEFINKYIKNFI